MKYIAVVFALALAAQPVFARTVTTFGIGNVSCASAFQRSNLIETNSWILGYVSARNFETTKNVGSTTDAAGIIGEVRLACSKSPSSKLGDIIFVVLDMMEINGL